MSIWLQSLLVGAGGALGALCRVGTAELVVLGFGKSWLGTLVANLVGCALMGCLKGLVDLHDWGSMEARMFLFGGFLGAFTTFSTFMADGATMWRDDRYMHVALHLCGSVFGGAVCFGLGWWLASRPWGAA